MSLELLLYRIDRRKDDWLYLVRGNELFGTSSELNESIRMIRVCFLTTIQHQITLK